jgi:hypothetical protein
MPVIRALARHFIEHELGVKSLATIAHEYQEERVRSGAPTLTLEEGTGSETCCNASDAPKEPWITFARSRSRAYI